MVDIVASLISLCTLAVSGGAKALKEIQKRTFSEPERELMITAAQSGEFYIMSVEEIPNWVRIGGKDFYDIHAPAISAKYLSAFKSLCERGYIEHVNGILFRLTSTGFEKARQVAKYPNAG